eukprot:CAMPEP_0117439920 /NCGR_PEP_ID=MMETSP0759-20121206/2810_1 /TAXON_ID=63605 /ORGANISM="Percolomonas cosmopolitus, Strain WS" /LENGTH=265 /DNA_ID=CAMNT_0005231643 /DNA_START=526 /DNA_END=1323 /DNA_ORIENTATION=-
MAQYAYYVFLKPIWTAKHSKKPQKEITDGDEDENDFLNAENGTVNDGYGTMYASMGVIFALTLIVKLAESTAVGQGLIESIFGSSSQSATVMSAASRKLLDVTICDASPEISEWQHILGIIAAWISGILYFTARIPQVYLNFKRKSVEGLSFPMFFCAVMGNLCYGIGVLLPGIPDWKRFIIEVFPYILGSLFTVFMSFVIVLQFFIYRWIPNWKKAAKKVVSNLPSPDGSFPFMSTSTIPATMGEDAEDDEDVYYYDTQSGVKA